MLEKLIIQKTLRVPASTGAAGDGTSVARQLDAALLDVGFSVPRARRRWTSPPRSSRRCANWSATMHLGDAAYVEAARLYLALAGSSMPHGEADLAILSDLAVACATSTPSANRLAVYRRSCLVGPCLRGQAATIAMTRPPRLHKTIDNSLANAPAHRST